MPTPPATSTLTRPDAREVSETVSQRTDQADPVAFPECRQLTGPRPHHLDQQREEIAVPGCGRDRVRRPGRV